MSQRLRLQAPGPAGGGRAGGHAGGRTPSSGPCPPGSALTPPRWSSRSSPGPPGSPSGPCAASPATPSPTWPPSPPAPLQLVTILGVLVFLCSLVLGCWSLWQKINGQALEGFTTVILLLLLIGSALMVCLGILGYYIAKIYEEIKDRPRYIVVRRTAEARQTAMRDKLRALLDPTLFRFILVGHRQHRRGLRGHVRPLQPGRPPHLGGTPATGSPPPPTTYRRQRRQLLPQQALHLPQPGEGRWKCSPPLRR